jgi:hypothetical protein
MRQSVGFHQYSPTTSTALDLTDGGSFSIPAGAEYVLLSVEVANIRFRDDGTAPTSAVGLLLLTTIGSPFEYWGPLVPISGKPAFRFIAASSGALLNAEFYRVSSFASGTGLFVSDAVSIAETAQASPA